MAERYTYGGKRYRLVDANNMLVVRTRHPAGVEDAVSRASLINDDTRRRLSGFTRVLHDVDSCVEVLRIDGLTRPKRRRDQAIEALRSQAGVRFAGRALCDPVDGAPVLYTENAFVMFRPSLSRATCRRRLREVGLRVKRELPYAPNAFFCCLPEHSGRAIFSATDTLLGLDAVLCAHPELVRARRQRVAAPQQWHLQPARINGNNVDAHANVVDAWAITRGAGVTIAVIDDGVDIDHDEFLGAGKIVAPLNTGVPTDHPLREDPRPTGNDSHGTACSGVACANGANGASGVAPDAALMPIRLRSGLGSQAEADAFYHAATRGADVISCSWGPIDGTWWNPNDPRHDIVTPLPDSTRLAIDFAVNNGRGGRGCVITWAAGNGNESVDNDGYAAYSSVIAVGACNDQSVRSAYSDVGDALWCCFPSSDGNPSLTPGIWTTDRRGSAGYNPGSAANGDVAGNYTNDFGGTSSSCPGAAGVAALIVARDPSLTWAEVREVMRLTADQIDPAGGNYDADGRSGQYGYGRLNATRAVEMAGPPVAGNRYTSRHTALADVAVRDGQTSTLDIAVGDAGIPDSVAVEVSILHTYSGDLRLVLVPPSGPRIVLREDQGGATDNVIERYSPASVAALSALVGENPAGRWRLEVTDNAAQDEGVIESFTMEFSRPQ